MTEELIHEIMQKLSALEDLDSRASALDRSVCGHGPFDPDSGKLDVSEDEDFWDDWCELYDIMTEWSGPYSVDTKLQETDFVENPDPYTPDPYYKEFQEVIAEFNGENGDTHGWMSAKQYSDGRIRVEFIVTVDGEDLGVAEPCEPEIAQEYLSEDFDQLATQ